MAESLDIFGAWREALQRWEKDTNSALNAVTSNEQYTQVMGRSLSLVARLQAQQAEATEKALNLANLPSKADFRALNGRLDDLDGKIAQLTEMVRRLAPDAPAPRAPGPPRTRKPPLAAQPSAKPTATSLTSKGEAS